MFALQDQARPSFSKKKLAIGLVILLATVGTTLATTLTINTGNRVTFGQGLYQIRACDGWIKISFEKTDTASGVMDGGSRVQAVSAVNVDSFNSLACKNTNFKIKLFKTGVSTALNLYTQADSTASNQVWLSVDNDGLVTILDTGGTNLGEFGDDAVGLGMDSVTGRYTIYFFTPLQPASNVNSYTVESGPNRA
jgi:hypothetical protein